MSYQNEKFVIKVNNDYDISNKLLFISFIFQKKNTLSWCKWGALEKKVQSRFFT